MRALLPHNLASFSLSSLASLEIDSQFFSLHQGIHLTEILAFQTGSLVASSCRFLGRQFSSSLGLGLLSKAVGLSVPFMAVAAESLSVESFRRSFSAEVSSSDFWRAWSENALQIGLMRGLHCYFPSPSLVLRHLSTDAICLLSRELLSGQHVSFSKSLFEIEAQNWNWSIGNQAFLKLSGGRFQSLERRCENSSRRLEGHPQSILSFASSGRSPYGESDWIQFKHPEYIKRYLVEHGMDERCVEVSLQNRAGTIHGVWAYAKAALTESHQRYGGDFLVRGFQMHPVPEFAHLRPQRLVEEVLPVLESSAGLSRRFPGRVLRNSLQYLSENHPIDLYKLRRKVQELGFPISTAQDAALEHWMMAELIPGGSFNHKMPCVGLLLRMISYPAIEEAALTEKMPQRRPVDFWRFNPRHYKQTDVNRRHRELMAEKPTDAEGLEAHLERLNQWIVFLAQNALLYSRFPEVRTHLREAMRQEVFHSRRHFAFTAKVLLRMQRVEWPEMGKTALFPLAAHPHFRPYHYSALFETIYASSRTEAAYAEKLYEHGIYLYELTGNFHLKEAFENEIRSSKCRDSHQRAYEFAQRIRRIALRI